MLKYSLLLFLFSSLLSFGQTKMKLPCIDKEFSVVVHIVRDSLGNDGVSQNKITNDVATLNTVFKPICASFKVCEFRYIDNFRFDTLDTTKGHWKALQQQFNAQNRINIYYVNEIKEPQDAAGFAGLGSICDTSSNGIVMKKSSGALVLEHEMGHYFGLSHTFEGSGTKDENVNGSNCSVAGDAICDTPADPFVKGTDPSLYVDSNCKFISTLTDKNGQYYDPIVGNTMSYYPEACNCGFTHEQYMKMAKTYLAKPYMW